MTIRICKIEKFIPAVGNPVFQIQEEASFNGILQLLSPRLPNSEELESALDKFTAAQQSRIDDLESQLSAANARIAMLESALPWNPRVMEAKHFVARITPNEMLTLAGSSDATVQSILGMLKDWVANDWPVVLESPEMQQAIGYLGAINLVAQERVTEMLKDCTKNEAYIADGQ